MSACAPPARRPAHMCTRSVRSVPRTVSSWPCFRGACWGLHARAHAEFSRQSHEDCASALSRGLPRAKTHCKPQTKIQQRHTSCGNHIKARFRRLVSACFCVYSTFRTRARACVGSTPRAPPERAGTRRASRGLQRTQSAPKSSACVLLPRPRTRARGHLCPQKQETTLCTLRARKRTTCTISSLCS